MMLKNMVKILFWVAFFDLFIHCSNDWVLANEKFVVTIMRKVKKADFLLQLSMTTNAPVLTEYLCLAYGPKHTRS